MATGYIRGRGQGAGGRRQGAGSRGQGAGGRGQGRQGARGVKLFNFEF
ncbi:MAG: hypothetical protein ACRAVC_14190 [Trichormus sp.]